MINHQLINGRYFIIIRCLLSRWENVESSTLFHVIAWVSKINAHFFNSHPIQKRYLFLNTQCCY